MTEKYIILTTLNKGDMVNVDDGFSEDCVAIASRKSRLLIQFIDEGATE